MTGKRFLILALISLTSMILLIVALCRDEWLKPLNCSTENPNCTGQSLNCTEQSSNGTCPMNFKEDSGYTSIGFGCGFTGIVWVLSIILFITRCIAARDRMKNQCLLFWLQCLLPIAALVSGLLIFAGCIRVRCKQDHATSMAIPLRLSIGAGALNLLSSIILFCKCCFLDWDNCCVKQGQKTNANLSEYHNLSN